ncbi:MrcB family domain-containing protein [Actinokineospora sp. HUAS TT18]|uniref:MrcB family domain-containing protein n=1 Tax=Actinokineospora sp. HUAS TT18 TaxID=3447451 RepID=UPI003F522504
MLRDLFDQVLAAQREYSPKKTEAMVRRGELIGGPIARWIEERLPRLRQATIDDLAVDASDGKGLKAEIPWVRVHSSSRSPRATDGWYVVYLFDARGESVYLTLMQGTTTWIGQSVVTRPISELRAGVSWARGLFGEALSARPDHLREIDLKGRASKRALGYEAGAVAAFEYRRGALPDDDVMERDLVFLVSVLGRLHHAEQDTSDIPSDLAAEVAHVLTPTTRSARGGVGQGTGLSHAERVAIERRSVFLACEHLVSLGFSVRDVGATESYDIDARRRSERVYVEVKGTTSAVGAEIILTKNEVDLNEARYPDTMLIVVSGIELDRSEVPPRASGGALRVVHPWSVAQARLVPLAYRYTVDDPES